MSAEVEVLVAVEAVVGRRAVRQITTVMVLVVEVTQEETPGVAPTDMAAVTEFLEFPLLLLLLLSLRTTLCFG